VPKRFDEGKSATLSVKPLTSACKAIIVHLPDGRTKTISPTRGGRIVFSVGL
jgi:hypothetical protein